MRHIWACQIPLFGQGLTGPKKNQLIKRLIHGIEILTGFSRRESRAFIILLPLLFLFICAPFFYTQWVQDHFQPGLDAISGLDSLILISEAAAEKRDVEASRAYFPFDPNEASREDFSRLGFKKDITFRIMKYREKGGRFRWKSDLKKIYGMDSALWEGLRSYMLLPEGKINPSFNRIKRENDRKGFIPEKFDINLADTMQLRKIRGIGKVLSLRITKFRDKLGGFIALDQLREVYGLDSMVVGRLMDHVYISSDFVPRKIPVNLASEKELADHPYVSWEFARILVAYRFQHGDFKRIDELYKMEGIQKKELEKVMVYFTINHGGE